MRERMILLPALLLLSCTPPADKDDANTDPDSDTTDTDVSDAPSDAEDPASDAETDVSDVAPPDPWTLSSHPCPGINRTDALWVDDDGATWVGCGSGAEGTGLFVRTAADGAFAAPSTNPRDFFDTWRVLSISRSADGYLYVAGTNTAQGNQMVVRLDDAGAVSAVYTAPDRPMTGQRFVAGGFRRASNGRAIIESLTGTDLLYRATDADPWVLVTSADYSDATNHQFLDIALDGDQFVAAGSTISEPPLLFVEQDEPTGEIGFDLVQLESGLGVYDGEMWAIAAYDGLVLVGGVNQDGDVGRFYTAAADGTGVAGFYADELASGRTNPTWVRGACASSHGWAVVGEEQVASGVGFVLFSVDGATWADITPADGVPKAISRCAWGADGALTVAGGDGFVGVWRPEE